MNLDVVPLTFYATNGPHQNLLGSETETHLFKAVSVQLLAAFTPAHTDRANCGKCTRIHFNPTKNSRRESTLNVILTERIWNRKQVCVVLVQTVMLLGLQLTIIFIFLKFICQIFS